MVLRYGYVEMTKVISTQPCLQQFVCIGLEVLQLLINTFANGIFVWILAQE
jgi:hypothetical protein